MATTDAVKLTQYRALTIDGDTTTIVMNPVMTPADNVNKRPNYGAFGELPATMGLASGTLTFSVELIPGNAWTKLFPICGGSSNVATGTTTWTFSRTDTVADLVLNTDGKQERLKNACGTFKVAGKTGETVTLEFTFTGRFDEVTDSSTGSVTVTPTASVPPVLGQAGTVVTLGSYSPITSDISIDLGNTVQVRVDAAQNATTTNGVRGGVIVNHSSSFSLTAEDAATATYDFRGIRDAGTLQTLTLTAGKFTFTGQAQLLTVPHKDNNGILSRDVGGQLVDRNGGGLQIIQVP
jgi:hypothetical protein